MDVVDRGIFDLETVRSMLPHQPPFLFVDRVIELEPGRRGVALKNVTAAEFYAPAHFPGRPIMPGVLIVEGCAQLGAIVMAAALGTPTSGAHNADAVRYPVVGLLASIDRFKFLSPAEPGDQLVLEVTIGKRMQGLLQLSAAVRCQRRSVAEGHIVVTLQTQP